MFEVCGSGPNRVSRTRTVTVFLGYVVQTIMIGKIKFNYRTDLLFTSTIFYIFEMTCLKCSVSFFRSHTEHRCLLRSKRATTLGPIVTTYRV